MIKKIVFSIILIYFCLAVRSQNYEIKGGVNLSKTLYFIGDTTVYTNNIPGINIGVIGEFKISNNLFQTVGIGFSQRGYKVSGGDRIKYRFNYIEIPANLVYKFEIDDVNLNFEIGPYTAIGINGKITQNGKSGKVSFGNATNRVRRFDLGMNVGYAVEFDYLTIRFSYFVGFINLSNNSTETLKNRAFYLTLGYKIN